MTLFFMSKTPLLQQEWFRAAVGLLLDIGLGFALDYITPFSLAEIFLTIISVNTLVLVLYFYREFSLREAAREKEQAHLLFSKEDILKMAQTIQSRALSSGFMNAMWTLMSFDDSLRNYFKNTIDAASKANVHTERLIDVSRVKTDEICEHIKDSWTYLKSGAYDIVFVKDAPFEMIFTGEEGIFFQSQRGGRVTLAIASSGSKFVSKLFEMYRGATARSIAFEADHFPPEFDKDKVIKWLENIKQRLAKQT